MRSSVGRFLDDLRDARKRVVRLAVVVIALDREQHLRLDLAEAVEHALCAEVGRAGRPDRAEAGSRQHENDGLGHVRHERRDAVAFLHASRRHAPAPCGTRRRTPPRSSCAGAPCPRPRTPSQSASSRRRSRFSAKFSFASGNHCAPGILSPSTSTRSPRVSAITPQKSQIAVQNCSGFRTDQS